MRLSSIKLSGFKSFVDPTTLHISGNLLGIVGPNGCGKSNIIDALVWVMGESSARHLRGDALTDIIFNGSSQRKPISQASVELIFDNSEKKLGAQYSSYNEISIKRQINRDSVSIYYLNGSRCRRRDITSIFLGTGLGPRSYAIIEQGTVSRLIEARPEELRAFIEEAAGISKYRVRRRETEKRIEYTKNNINRINDITKEVNVQLNHIQRQAKAAERFQALKKKQRALKSEYLALVWRDLKIGSDRKKELLGERENRVEAERAELRSIEAGIEKYRDELTRAGENFNRVQSDYYRISSEISQIEQKIQHTHEKQASLAGDLEQARLNAQRMREQDTRDRKQLEELHEKLADLEPKLHSSEIENSKAHKVLTEAESAMQVWQTEWDAYNQSHADFERHSQVDRTRIEHIEHNLDEIINRRKQLEDELQAIKAYGVHQQTRQTRENFNQKQSALATLRLQQTNDLDDVGQKREALALIGNQLDEIRSEQQVLKGRLVSLEELQQEHPGDNERLKRHSIETAGRLAEQLKIDTEWMKALETVAGSRLQHLYIDDFESLLERINDIDLDIGVASGGPRPEKHAKWTRLTEKIKNNISLPAVLESVFTAASFSAALEMRNELAPHESVVTADGVWLGTNWLIINRNRPDDAGVLFREQNITALRKKLQEVGAQVEMLEKKRDETGQALERAEHKQNNTRQQIQDIQSEITELSGTLAADQIESEQRAIRQDRIADELESLLEQERHERDSMSSIDRQLSNCDEDKRALHDRHEKLIALRDEYRKSLETARSGWQNAYEAHHRIALECEASRSGLGSLQQAIKRNETQLSQLDSRCEQLESGLNECGAPLGTFEADLKRGLDEKNSVEKTLAEVRADMQEVEANMREREQVRSQCEQKTRELNAAVEQANLAVNEYKVKLQAVEEQLHEAGRNAAALLENMEDREKQSDWKDKLDGITQKIQRLPPVNLAAIDEFAQLTERKTYLDSQLNDLNDSLATLEKAMNKIDRETRTRFKQTFDALNTNLGEMFPQLFGGGHAHLELTSNDLLETGATIMACPPGKRNSTIYLLSGGEKALTAIALIFAIFKLNPAPFCILDEVDAPLDDNNIERFGKLVASMSEEVQFIFVTHNKITMEITPHLLGVTMQEAGVSRLVSVDIDAAVKMAAIS